MKNTPHISSALSHHLTHLSLFRSVEPRAALVVSDIHRRHCQGLIWTFDSSQLRSAIPCLLCLFSRVSPEQCVPWINEGDAAQRSFTPLVWWGEIMPGVRGTVRDGVMYVDPGASSYVSASTTYNKSLRRVWVLCVIEEESEFYIHPFKTLCLSEIDCRVGELESLPSVRAFSTVSLVCRHRTGWQKTVIWDS